MNIKMKKEKKNVEAMKAKARAMAKKEKLESLPKRVVRESIRVLIISTILVTLGGIALKSAQGRLIALIPFLILIPALNKMLGDFGIIIVSKFTTMLYERKIRKPLLHSHNLKHLFREVFPIAILSAMYVSALATIVSIFRGFTFDHIFLLKIVSISVAITILLIFVHFFVAVVGGIYVYKKGEDPDDLLIPITTSIADLGSMILLVLMIIWLF